jgi:hypothetical protein
MLRRFGEQGEILFHYNLHVRINGAALRRVAEKTYNRDKTAEEKKMIGEGQDIATGTVSLLLYNLLHLPSLTTCPIPSSRQSFLSPCSQ